MPNSFCLITIFNWFHKLFKYRNEFLFFIKTQSNIVPYFGTFLAFGIDQFILIERSIDIIFWLCLKLKKTKKFNMKNQKFDEFVEWNRMYTCKIEPRARSAFEQFSFSLVTSKSLSNAPFVSLIRKYKMPISVSVSTFSVVILKNWKKKWNKMRIFYQLKKMKWNKKKPINGIHTALYFPTFQWL